MCGETAILGNDGLIVSIPSVRPFYVPIPLDISIHRRPFEHNLLPSAPNGRRKGGWGGIQGFPHFPAVKIQSMLPFRESVPRQNRRPRRILIANAAFRKI